MKREKTTKRGLTNSNSCVFYRANVEDRNHLFFGCHFIAGIWLRILRLCGNTRMPRNWENEFLWVIAAKGKSFCSITNRIAWGATIYHLWKQRNSRIDGFVAGWVLVSFGPWLPLPRLWAGLWVWCLFPGCESVFGFLFCCLWLLLVVSGCCLLFSFRGGSVRFSFLLDLGLVYSLVVGLAFWK